MYAGERLASLFCLSKDKPHTHFLEKWGFSIISFSESVSCVSYAQNICKGCSETEEMSLLKHCNFSNLACIEKTNIRPHCTRWPIKDSSYFFIVFKNHLTFQDSLCDWDVVCFFFFKHLSVFNSLSTYLQDRTYNVRDQNILAEIRVLFPHVMYPFQRLSREDFIAQIFLEVTELWKYLPLVHVYLGIVSQVASLSAQIDFTTETKFPCHADRKLSIGNFL